MILSWCAGACITILVVLIYDSIIDEDKYKKVYFFTKK